MLYLSVFEVSFFIIVDCEWNDWTIGECSKSCGGGFRTRTRYPRDEFSNGPEDCSGPSTISESCNLRQCPGIHLYFKKT